MFVFEEAVDFLLEVDYLLVLLLEEWLGLLFMSLEFYVDFWEVVVLIQEWVGFLLLDELQFMEEGSQDYLVKVNWVFYCDNYLEGFYVFFVYLVLNIVLDFGVYDYEIFDWCNLQIGIVKLEEFVFDLLEGYFDYGWWVYVYYFFFFFNLMFNFYFWGLLFNVVEFLFIGEIWVWFCFYVFFGIVFSCVVNNID